MTITRTQHDVERGQARLLGPVLVALSLAFWGLIFTRSILALDDMGFIERGRRIATLADVVDALKFDVLEQNGRIADTVLSVVGAAGGEPLVRVYFAIACTLLVPTAAMWLSALLPLSARHPLPSYVLPAVAASAPWLLFALDRRLISQLVLFGAASSGYFTGLFLITLGLRPVMRLVDGETVPTRSMLLAAPPLLIGAMFHEVLAAIVLGAAAAVAYLAVRRPEQRKTLTPALAVMAAAVVLKASTPGLWSRATDGEQRQLGDAGLLDRTDTAIAFALIAFVPLLGYLAVAVIAHLPDRGIPLSRLGILALLLGGLGVVALGYRVLDGYPLPGVVTALAGVALVVAAVVIRPAELRPIELVAVGATLAAFAFPVYGGLLPGRAWFFGEFLALLLGLSWLLEACTHTSAVQAAGRFFAVAIAGAGIAVAPVLAYEMLDKVNDNYAWRAVVDAQMADQSDGVVEIPWTYPWDDMRPSFVLGTDHEAHEQLVRDYYDLPDSVSIEWNGSTDWTTG